MQVRRATAHDARAVATVHVRSWQSTYKGLLPDDYLAGLSIDQSESVWGGLLGSSTGPNGSVLALVEEGEVIGFAPVAARGEPRA